MLPNRRLINALFEIDLVMLMMQEAYALKIEEKVLHVQPYISRSYGSHDVELLLLVIWHYMGL
jgi:hypothetical protein